MICQRPIVDGGGPPYLQQVHGPLALNAKSTNLLSVLQPLHGLIDFSRSYVPRILNPLSILLSFNYFALHELHVASVSSNASGSTMWYPLAIEHHKILGWNMFDGVQDGMPAFLDVCMIDEGWR